MCESYSSSECAWKVIWMCESNWPSECVWRVIWMCQSYWSPEYVNRIDHQNVHEKWYWSWESYPSSECASRVLWMCIKRIDMALHIDHQKSDMNVWVVFIIRMCVKSNMNAWVVFIIRMRMKWNMNGHQEDRLNYRSLLQNIVSFIGLFCKRDL